MRLAGGNPTPPTSASLDHTIQESTMTDRQTTRLSTTEEQKAKVKATTERDAKVVELHAEELEQRIAPVRFG
jgi:hypothetical protein